ncbi:LysR family transcriptional regulator [Saccharothrix variisporea]|uniref:DNA-binding transcriptional LysR family regulator n=1 Tax=Saccharothrix variisporea TaxID=543527 RepID=A0A495X5T6_9PSEU|nr:LysR family transcriptional regulator [Saccharothrix variisporea]RKT68003.1 DNA-binding transcriptional LysR family regulator [Saccharothrix variisporea]
MDVDTRLVRAFLAVAKEGNLTRAAERLYVSQPALTKQIRRLETDLGVRLFSRSRTGMALTEAGQTLADSAQALLGLCDDILRKTKSAAASAARVLRVGFIASAANEATQDIIAEFGRLMPGWRVEMRQATWSEPTAGLAEGEVDVALLRAPFPDQESYHVEILLTEPRFVALPTTHPLATRTTIPFRGLWTEPFVAAPAETGDWRDYWLATSERDTPPVIGAVTDQPDAWLQAIANGYGVALAPESATRYYARPGITYRLVPDVSPSQVCVAWPKSTPTTPAQQAFIHSCHTTTPHPHP